MSLINQMLRDLDARSASAAERNGIAEQVRALPPVRTSPWRLLALVGASALMGGVVVWGVQRLSLDAQPPTTSLPIPLIAVPMPAAPTDSVSEPTPSPASLGDSFKPNYGLRLETRLPQALPDRTSVRGEKQAAVPNAQLSAPTKQVQGQIDKQARGTSHNDVAENEYRKAHAALKRGAVDEAITSFRSVLQVEPQHGPARQALLAQLVARKQWEEAQALAREGLKLDPTRMDWVILLARLQVELGDSAGALETLSHYSPLAERNPEFQAFHALLLQRAKQYGEAAQKYRAALATRPTEGRWWYGLGMTLAAENREAEARDAFQKAREAGNLPPELAASVEQRLR